MNFFEHQARARSSSRRLVVLFLLAVAAIVVAINAVILLAIGFSQPEGNTADLRQLPVQFPEVIFWTTLVTLSIIFFASLYRTGRLRAGGGQVATALGGKLIPADAADPKLRRLRNVVEEMAIASGVPVPQIYVLPDEQAINAFAAGYTPANAAVAVTRGALDKLTRDELQGVIAHEFSHVLNGDMRLNIRLMGLLFGVLVLHVIGREVLGAVGRGRSSGSKKEGGIAGIALVALAIMLIGWIGVFFGRLIKASVSRQRELLADASAVQFTRQASGLAGALKKIGGFIEGSKLSHAKTEEVSHMLFGDGVGYSQLFATHPPLIERIKAVDPAFKPEQWTALQEKWSEPAYQQALAAEGSVAAMAAAAPSMAAAGLAAQVGNPSDEDVRNARALHASLPDALLVHAHDPQAAPLLLLALLLDARPDLRARQLQLVASQWQAGAEATVAGISVELALLHRAQYLPLAAMAFPALRQRPPPDLTRLLKTVAMLAQADGQTDIFEYGIGRMLRVFLLEVLKPAQSKVVGRKRLAEMKDEFATLLAVIAHHGHTDAGKARKAFDAGVRAALRDVELAYAPPADWAPALDRALEALNQLNAPSKELLLEGLAATLGHDGRISLNEAELLRVVCAGLHCPLPPLLGSAA